MTGTLFSLFFFRKWPSSPCSSCEPSAVLRHYDSSPLTRFSYRSTTVPTKLPYFSFFPSPSPLYYAPPPLSIIAPLSTLSTRYRKPPSVLDQSQLPYLSFFTFPPSSSISSSSLTSSPAVVSSEKKSVGAGCERLEIRVYNLDIKDNMIFILKYSTDAHCNEE